MKSSWETWRREKIPPSVYKAIWIDCFESFLSLPRLVQQDRMYWNLLDIHPDGRMIRPDVSSWIPFYMREPEPSFEERRSLGWTRHRVVRVAGPRCEIPIWLDRFIGWKELSVVYNGYHGYLMLKDVLKLPRVPEVEWCNECRDFRGGITRDPATGYSYEGYGWYQSPMRCQECTDFRTIVKNQTKKDEEKWQKTSYKIKQAQSRMKDFRAYQRNQQAGRFHSVA